LVGLHVDVVRSYACTCLLHLPRPPSPPHPLLGYDSFSVQIKGGIRNVHTCLYDVCEEPCTSCSQGAAAIEWNDFDKYLLAPIDNSLAIKLSMYWLDGTTTNQCIWRRLLSSAAFLAYRQLRYSGRGSFQQPDVISRNRDLGSLRSKLYRHRSLWIGRSRLVNKITWEVTSLLKRKCGQPLRIQLNIG